MMRPAGRLVTLGALCLPLLSVAAPDPEPVAIEFAPPTQDAFDHTGRRVSHSFLPGGAMLAEHRGTMGHVAVARIGPGGELETLCTMDEKQARDWMAGKVPASDGEVILHLQGQRD